MKTVYRWLYRALSVWAPSESAAGVRPGQVGVLITVTVINGSQNPIDLSGALVRLRAGSQGEQAESVFDSAQGVGSGLTGQVAPQRRATAEYGFAVAEGNLDQIDVEVVPGFDYKGALFIGRAS